MPSLYNLSGQSLKNNVNLTKYHLPEIILKKVQIQNNTFVVGNKIFIVNWKTGDEIEGNIVKIYRNHKGFFIKLKNENNNIKTVNVNEKRNKFNYYIHKYT